MEAALEAVLFVSSEPVPRARLLELFEEEERERPRRPLGAVLARYSGEAGEAAAACMVEDVAGGVRLATRPELVRLAAPLLRRRGRHQALDGGARDAGHHRLPPADHRPGDPGAARRRARRACSRPCSSAGMVAHRRPQGGGGQALPLRHDARVPASTSGSAASSDLPPLEEFEETFGAGGARAVASRWPSRREERGSRGRRDADTTPEETGREDDGERAARRARGVADAGRARRPTAAEAERLP